MLSAPILGRLQAAALFTLPFLTQGAHGLDATRDSRGGRRADESEAEGLVLSTDTAFDGYTLLAPLRSRRTFLLDMDGRVVHTWKSEHTPGNSVYLLENGHLLRPYRDEDAHVHAGGAGGGIEEFDWDGELVWSTSLSSEHVLSHHDVEPLSNGNVLVIAWELLSANDALAAGRDPENLAEDGFWPDMVLELRPTRPRGAEVVWRWRSFDHLVQDRDASKPNYGDVAAHPERIDLNADCSETASPTAEELRRQEELAEQMRALGYVGSEGEEETAGEEAGTSADGAAPRGPMGGPPGDWLHANSVDYLPEHDLIALSIHNLSEVWVIDHSTTTEEAASGHGGRFGKGGDLLYRWGNPAVYGAGTAADQQLFAQHDARWLVGDDGSLALTVFNNGMGRPDGEFSSVEELALPFDREHGFVRPTGEAFGPAAPRWTYRADGFFSAFISGAERLPNGDTLICSGAQSRVFEVTPSGEVAWDYHSTLGRDERHPAGDSRRPPRNGRTGPGRTRPSAPLPGGPGRGHGRPRPNGPAPGAGPGPGGPGGPGGAEGLFRAKRLAVDYPGLSSLLE